MTAPAIAVIPARGGSKRIPRKNVIDFFGRPIIAWTVAAALESGCFKRVLVSTDNEEIAVIARDHGAEVPFLRTVAADDHAPVSAATAAALDQAATHWREEYEIVVQLMPNCPLRGATHIRAALAAFARRSVQFQISCFKFSWMNPWWAVRLDSDGHPTAVFPGMTERRSQELEALYCPTGAIWIADVEALRQSGTFYGPGHVFEPLPWTAAVDIDDADDLAMARAAWLMQRGNGVSDG